jgi:3-(3-hydroxy-phenyl)propionate hydroxylase
MAAAPPPRCDVVVVGLGPVGATLACLLANRGVSVLVLERAGSMYPLPRAVHFDDETLRVFQACGADVAEAIDRVVRINPGMQFVDKQGNMILDWPRPQVVTPNGYNASYRFHQPDVEGLLGEAATTRPAAGLVTVCRATAVVAIDDGGGGGGGVTVSHCPWDQRMWGVAEGAPTGTTRARYVVGCDGAGSFVRKAIGAAVLAAGGGGGADADADADEDGDNMEDLGWSQRWLVVDAVLNRDMPSLGDHTRQTCNRARPSTFTRQPGEPSPSPSGPIRGSRVRWEVAILPHETDEEISSPLWYAVHQRPFPCPPSTHTSFVSAIGCACAD